MAYVKSSLATSYPAHPNNYGYFIKNPNGTQTHCNEGRLGNSIMEITIHHMAGVATAAGCGYGFQNPARGGSTHYGVGYDGSIGSYVSETCIAWGNSNWDSNCRAVSIETSNSSTGGDWLVSDKALNSLIKLVADIAKRNNLGKLVKGKNLTWHQMYAATACPGPYLLSKLDYIIEQANNINFPKPKPTIHNGKLDGNNIQRTADTIIRYTYASNRLTTKTNKYGYEIAVDSASVITQIQNGVGNMAIPANGCVYSGHGIGATYLKNLGLKTGNSLWQESGAIKCSKKIYKHNSGKNIGRATNFLVVYNKGETTKTNKYGYEVAIINDKAQAMPIYGKGNMTIPKGGWVLSGHGTAGSWMVANIKKGTKVVYDEKRGLIIIG